MLTWHVSFFKTARFVVFSTFLAILTSVALFVGGVDREDGLVAHWEFNQNNDNTAEDSSGNGNDGTLVPANSTEAKWGTGQFAGSLSLSGENDHFVRVPSSASLNNVKKQITVVAHIYPRALWAPGSSSRAYIAVVQRQWREGSRGQYYLGYGPKNNVLNYKWHLGLVDADMSIYRLPKGQDKPAIGEWVHLAGTYNGETGEMSLYVNGDLIGGETHVGEIRLDPESFNRPLAIGAEINGPNTDDATGEFNGYIDDVRVYNRALSDKEIKILAQEARMRTNEGTQNGR